MPFKNLPDAAYKIWENVYNQAKDSGNDEELASKKAWGAVKNAGWEKDDDGKWVKKSILTEFSLTIKRAVFDEKTQEMRWRADTSDVDDDSYGDNMTLDLFRSFIDRIENSVLPPEEFRSNYWSGGQPYVSVSHYEDFNGDGVPGVTDATYIDGKYLKARGRFFDTPLGRACFKALCKDLSEKSDIGQDRVRVSIAFLDYKHQHKSNGYIFERKSLDDICPECLLEMIKGESAGKRFLDGHLIHYALTRVPVNTRTVMEVEKSMTTRKEDAESIVGEELADELENKAMATVGKSQVLVEMSATNEQVETPCELAVDAVETPVVKSSTVDEKSFQMVFDALSVMADDLKELKKSMVVSHPLDSGFSKLRSDYDAISSSDVSQEEKLRMIQQSFNDLGETIIEAFKPKVVEVTQKQEIVDVNKSLVEALSAAMSPFAQKLDLIAAQLQQTQIVQTQKSSVIPERKSINPLLAQKAAQPVINSVTPQLRKLVERTT